MYILNAFALRSTDPGALKAAVKAGQDPIGPDNDKWIQEFTEHPTVKLVIVGWGKHASLLARNHHLTENLAGVPLHLYGRKWRWFTAASALSTQSSSANSLAGTYWSGCLFHNRVLSIAAGLMPN
jgi:hypothetical protein